MKKLIFLIFGIIVMYQSQVYAQYLGGSGNGTAFSHTEGKLDGPQVVSQVVFTTLPPEWKLPSHGFPIHIEILDQDGFVVMYANDSVTLSIHNNNGTDTLVGTTTVNAVNGIANFSNISINSTVFGLRIDASYDTHVATSTPIDVFNIYRGGSGNGTAFSYSEGKLNGPQVVSQVVFTTLPPEWILPSHGFPIQVELRDIYGGVVLSANDSVTLSIHNNISSDTLVGTTTVNAVNGIANFSNISINSTVFGLRIDASYDTHVATSTPIDVFNIYRGGSGNGTAFSYSEGKLNGPQVVSQVVFTTLPPEWILPSHGFPIQVELRDIYGGVVLSANDSVTLSIHNNISSDTLVGTTRVNAVNGIANFSNISINRTVFGLRIDASYDTHVATSTPIDIFNIYRGGSGNGTALSYSEGKLNGPQVVSQVVFSIQPPSGLTPTQTFPIQISLQDADGFIVLSASNTVTLSIANNPGSGTLSGVTAVNAVNGIANFSNLILSAMGVGYTLRASYESLSTVSIPIDVFTSIYAGGDGKGAVAEAGTPNVFLTDKVFTGSVSSDIGLAANWSGGSLPHSEVGIVLGSGIQPVLHNNYTVSASSTIVLFQGATLTVTPNRVLVVDGKINNAGTIILQSDITGSASIGNSSGYISGNAIVHRYIPAMSNPASNNSFGRRWRFISSPVQQATLQGMRQCMFVTGPGTGTTLGTINSNGFDANHNNSPTVFRYHEASAGASSIGWVAPSHVDSALIPGHGYRMFVRGDRSDISRIANNTHAPQNEVTLHFAGTINQGNITMPVSYTNSSSGANEDGWNLLGNPYPSAINWNTVWNDVSSHTHISNTIWIFDPVSNGYITYNALSHTGTNGFNGIIGSGQSFWVKATQAGASLMLKENHKANSTSNGMFKNTSNSAFYIELLRDSFNRAEMAVKYLHGATTLFDAYDSRMLGSSVAISAWDADSVDLSISCRPVNTTSNDTIRLNVQGATGNYTLGFKNSDQIAVQEHITLVDALLNTYTDLRQHTSYPFAINASNAATHGRNRFYIVVSNNNPVPVELLSFTGQKVGPNQVQLLWQTASEVNFSHYDIEKSTDGELYRKIGMQKGRGSRTSGSRYVSMDNEASGINYYRLKMVDKDGSYNYSQTVVVSFEQLDKQINSEVFPNPSTGSITIRTKAGNSYRLVDIQGRIIRQGIADAEMHWQNLEQGVYILQLHEQGRIPYSVKIIVTYPE
jgi:hypothetical protein